MQAALYRTFGAAQDVLAVEAVEKPEPGPGEVLVRVHASGVNPSDVKKRAGAFPGLLDGGFIIPNSDGGGVIKEVGEGVDKSRIGERVWIYQGQHQRRFGTAAKFIAIDSRRVHRIPDGVDFETAACLGIPAMTAHRCVFADGHVSDQTVLVTGAAGRVGNYAVQWASRDGARVIATASNEVDEQACHEAGARKVVNHRDENLAAAILDANEGKAVDRVIDLEFGTNLGASVEALRTGGTIAAYGSAQSPEPVLPFYELMYKDLTVHFVIVYDMPESAKDHAVADIQRALRKDRLQHRIAAKYPLEEIATANDVVAEGKSRGAIILEI
jgi:NADPH2:quinone reductase